MLEEHGDKCRRPAAHGRFSGGLQPEHCRRLAIRIQDACRAPRAADTHVIITEYDLPRKHHRAARRDSRYATAMVWYSSFGEQAVGRMDPKTGKVTEYQFPIQKPGWPTGELGLQTGSRRQSLVRHDLPGGPWRSSTARPRNFRSCIRPPNTTRT